MSAARPRRLLTAIFAMLACYAAGLLLILAAAFAGRRPGLELLVGGTALLAVGATLSFLAKAMLLIGVPESRRRLWIDASARRRAHITFSLALWALPAIAFWLITARELVR